MSQTHTIGPWWIEQSPQDERWPDLHTNHIMGWFHYPDGREKTRCEVATVDNADSDARLIAAAPQLLEVLENAVASGTLDDCVHDPSTRRPGAGPCSINNPLCTYMDARAAIRAARGEHEGLEAETTWRKSLEEHEREYDAKQARGEE